MNEQAATRRKRLDRHHPTGLCDVGESPMCFLGGVRLSEATAVSPNRFAPWRQQNRKWLSTVVPGAPDVFSRQPDTA